MYQNLTENERDILFEASREEWKRKNNYELRISNYEWIHVAKNLFVEQIKVYYDGIGKTLTVWFRDPSKESVCEDVGYDAVLMKSHDDEILGIRNIKC